jgi:hypothetical protein
LTAIETSPQNENECNPILKYSVFLNDTEWSLEDFVEKVSHEHKYDIVTSFHSWYAISPSYLVKLFRFLQTDGIMALTIAPFKNNIINQITSVVDEFVRSKFPTKDKPYPMKKIKNDPCRNFAEDILFACETFFGKSGITTKKSLVRIRTSEFLDESGALTKKGRMIADLFAHRILSLDEDTYAAVASVITAHTRDGYVPCEEWHIDIDKAEVLAHGRARLFGIQVPLYAAAT